MKHGILILFLLLAAQSSFAVTLTCSAHGKTFQTPMGSAESRGYSQIPGHCSKLIRNHWGRFGFEKKYWDDGWGYYDACNPDSVLNRTLKALELLKISQNRRYSGRAALNYAYGASSHYINHLRVGCAYDKENRVLGVHHKASFWQRLRGKKGSGNITLFQNLFAGTSVDVAGVIVHEAFHKHKFHNAGKKCSRKASCDSKWNYGGANTHHVLYHWWYGVASRNSTKFMRQIALDRARSNHDRGFKRNPKKKIPHRAR